MNARIVLPSQTACGFTPSSAAHIKPIPTMMTAARSQNRASKFEFGAGLSFMVDPATMTRLYREHGTVTRLGLAFHYDI
jgi:hypothetical protein